MPVIPSPVLNRGCLPVCAWIKPATFPLFPGICDASGSLSRPVFTISTVGAFGLTMRWLGAQISSPVADCGNSNPYVSAFGSGGAFGGGAFCAFSKLLQSTLYAKKKRNNFLPVFIKAIMRWVLL